MKYIYILFIIFHSLHIGAQQIEFFGGPNHTTLFDNKNSSGFFQTSYENRQGISFGVELNHIKIDKSKVRARMTFERINAVLNGNYIPKIEGRINADVQKSILTLDLYPLNKTFFKRLSLGLGFTISGLLNENYSGREIFPASTPGVFYHYEIALKYANYSTKLNLGLRILVSYDFPIDKNHFITPQYSFHLGLTNEFENFIVDTRSIRHFIGIGIKKNLKNREKE